MNDIPSREPGKPRFLAGDDPEAKESTGYRGRFLNNEPQKEPAPEAAEDDPIEPDFTLPPEPETTVETGTAPLSMTRIPFRMTQTPWPTTRTCPFWMTWICPRKRWMALKSRRKRPRS